MNHRSRCRIARDAATEVVDISSEFFFVALAKEIDLGNYQSGLPFEQSLSPDVGQQPGLPNPDFYLATHLASHLDGWIRMIEQLVENRRVHQYFGTRPRDLDDFTNLMAFTLSWRGSLIYCLLGFLVGNR